jgi:hypothetical protein
MVENLPAAAQRAEIVAKSLQLKDTCRAERLRLEGFEDSTIPALQLLTKCHSGQAAQFVILIDWRGERGRGKGSIPQSRKNGIKSGG